MKKRAVVICPGRGSYTKETLAYLKNANPSFISKIDHWRTQNGQVTISELDSMPAFKPMLHTLGENASALIYACALADFQQINREQFEIVAVTGNSMGWYLALACAEALNEEAAFTVVNTMGSMMKDGTIGGQVLYSLVDDEWKLSEDKKRSLEQVLVAARTQDEIKIYTSIYLGGSIVLGANAEGISFLMKNLPPTQNSPMTLLNHAAFHTPLLQETSKKAFEILPQSLWSQPKIPLVDGRGAIWKPKTSRLDDLYRYTLGHQVIAPYDFTTTIEVCLKEFMPESLILLGPGSNLGGALAQTMIQLDWQGLKNKEMFTQQQIQNPFVLAMGREDQRAKVVF